MFELLFEFFGECCYVFVNGLNRLCRGREVSVSEHKRRLLAVGPLTDPRTCSHVVIPITRQSTLSKNV